MHLHGYEAGPAILETTYTEQRPYILFGVGKQYEENEAGPAWMWAPASCAGWEGLGGGREFPPVVEGRKWTR